MSNSWRDMVLATIVTLFFVVHVSNGLYFHIGETERKCFIEEIPDETMVTGKLKNVKSTGLLCSFSIFKISTNIAVFVRNHSVLSYLCIYFNNYFLQIFSVKSMCDMVNSVQFNLTIFFDSIAKMEKFYFCRLNAI